MPVLDDFLPTDKSVSVGTSVVEISPETGNLKRKVFFIVNTSTGGQIISIAFGKDAVSGSGIVLSAGNGWAESVDAIFQPRNLKITAVSSAAGGTVAFHEQLWRG